MDSNPFLSFLAGVTGLAPAISLAIGLAYVATYSVARQTEERRRRHRFEQRRDR